MSANYANWHEWPSPQISLTTQIKRLQPRCVAPLRSLEKLGIIRVKVMDDTKCKSLKADLEGQPEPQIVSIERFFDGNDDLGSIGCNLVEHPGIDSFRDLLTGLLRRQDVQAVYARIYELDPGEDCWPFTDTIFVVGTISPDVLRGILAPLEPSDVGPGEAFGDTTIVKQMHDAPVLAVWWD